MGKKRNKETVDTTYDASKDEKIKAQNSFLVVCVCSIIFILMLCYFGINSFKGTSAAGDATVCLNGREKVTDGNTTYCCPSKNDDVLTINGKLYCIPEPRKTAEMVYLATNAGSPQDEACKKVETACEIVKNGCPGISASECMEIESLCAQKNTTCTPSDDYVCSQTYGSTWKAIPDNTLGYGEDVCTIEDDYGTGSTDHDKKICHACYDTAKHEVEYTVTQGVGNYCYTVAVLNPTTHGQVIVYKYGSLPSGTNLSSYSHIDDYDGNEIGCLSNNSYVLNINSNLATKNSNSSSYTLRFSSIRSLSAPEKKISISTAASDGSVKIVNTLPGTFPVEFSGWKLSDYDSTKNRLAEYSLDNGSTWKKFTTTTGVVKLNAVKQVAILDSYSVNSTLEAVWKDEIIDLPTVSKEGNTCSWNIDDGIKRAEGTTFESGSKFTITSKSKSNILLTAVCVPNSSIEPAYKITLNANGGDLYECNEGEIGVSCEDYAVYSGASAVRTFKVKEGETFDLGNEDLFKVSKVGSKLLGWAESATATTYKYGVSEKIDNISSNLTLYAVWDGNGSSSSGTVPSGKYVVVYDANGGTGAPASGTYANVQSFTVSTSIPNKQGVNFINWNTRYDGKGDVYEPGKTYSRTGTDSTVTLYAMYGYTIKFDTNGKSATAPADDYVYVGSDFKIKNNQTVSKNGFDFDGWSLSADDSFNTYNIGSTIKWDDLHSKEQNLNIVLYAQWSVSGSSSTGGVTPISKPTSSLCKSGLKYTGSSQNITSATSGTGYTLSGYKQTNAGTYTVTATLVSGYEWNDGSATAVSFKCSISKATPSVTISKSSLSVNEGDASSFTEKANIVGSFKNVSGKTDIATINPDSYSSVAANTTKSVSVVGLSAGTSVVKVTFTPKDTANYNSVDNTVTVKVIGSSSTVAPSTYTVSYNGNGGTGSMNTTSCTYGSSCTLRANSFTRDGYTFVGWTTTPSSSLVVYSDKQSFTYERDANLTLYAVWSSNSSGGDSPSTNTYTATFNSNGGTLDGQETLSCETTSNSCEVNDLPTASKSGYTFKGWGESSSCSSGNSSKLTLSKNTTYYACWQSNSTSNPGGGDVENPQTGEGMIVFVAIMGIAAISYLVYYYKRLQND